MNELKKNIKSCYNEYAEHYGASRDTPHLSSIKPMLKKSGLRIEKTTRFKGYHLVFAIAGKKMAGVE